MPETIHRYREDTAYKKLRSILKEYDLYLVDDLYLASTITQIEDRLNNLNLDPKTESRVLRLITQ